MKIEWDFKRDTISHLPTHRPCLGHPSPDYLPGPLELFVFPHKISSISRTEIDEYVLLNINILIESGLRKLNEYSVVNNASSAL